MPYVDQFRFTNFDRSNCSSWVSYADLEITAFSVSPIRTCPSAKARACARSLKCLKGLSIRPVKWTTYVASSIFTSGSRAEAAKERMSSRRSEDKQVEITSSRRSSQGQPAEQFETPAKAADCLISGISLPHETSVVVCGRMVFSARNARRVRLGHYFA